MSKMITCWMHALTAILIWSIKPYNCLLSGYQSNQYGDQYGNQTNRYKSLGYRPKKGGDGSYGRGKAMARK